MRDGRPAPSPLERCIAIDTATFSAEHWGRQPLLTRCAQLPARFDDLLDLDAADELLSRRGLRTPFLRIARDGEVLDSKHFTGRGGVGAEIADQVRDDRILQLFAEGCTVVLQGLHRLWPPITDFVGRLAAELGHPCQVNAYITPPSSRGFSAHYDVHDVFVLQIAGTKRWTVHRPVLPSPLRSQPWNQHAAAVAEGARQLPLIDTVLEAGDTLYLPRGYLHSASALGDTSAHLTIGVHTVTRFALVDALCALVAGDERLRESLPVGIDIADPDQLAPHLGTVVDVLTEALRGVAVQDVARAVREQAWTGNRPEPLRPLANAGFARSLRGDERVRLRAGLAHRLTPTSDGVTLELADRTITLPASTAAALELLLLGGSVEVAQLPDLADDDQLVLVRRLLREGVLVPAVLR
jgi:bifunctional lysine-specific demethylase and histidyl-hydroxylase NO66